ncbi:GntR family transcriptional regulator [Paraburkholderia lycopersici]|uniref:DNA-binding transcriptional regulator, GntR family n=1 Tax=Paraburkholderia lycopersici TaxID=416944 RepID=A0A1G6LW23_9BURK|nr:GntR family transcriptional regulator [Paraburkholderia lycopersici]SDC47430.1 DNA-binding transcriptional regulator, GntR family [Paraburkholderia lycopersici]
MNSPRRVVQSDRLRDQVYRMLREDLRNGLFYPGQRLVELELAAHYGVSRTPIREALFQLAREGLITDSDRGYSLPADSHDDFLDRIAVRLTLDATLAAHAAKRATDGQKTELAEHFEGMQAAHAEGDAKGFSNSAHLLRLCLIEAGHNEALSRVCRVLEDQFLIMRNKQYREADNRALALEYDGKLVDAIQAADSRKAAEAAREYMVEIIDRFGGTRPANTLEPWVAKREADSE